MIDWFYVFSNFLWILGLAWLLAAVSYVYWESSVMNVRFMERLQSPRWERRLNVGLVLFSAGLAATSTRLLERILWGVLTLWSLVAVFQTPG